MSQKILAVGDLHGDWAKLNQLITKKNPQIVLQCGDFGWWPKFDRVGQNIYHLGSNHWSHQGIKVGSSVVYWCDGNHEDHESLDSMGTVPRDTVHCYDGVIYKPRGTTLELSDGRIVLFVGGGESIDKDLRVPGHDWFDREIPNRREMDRALSHERVDIVISHTCPTYWQPKGFHMDKCNDPTRHMLDLVLSKYKPDLWYHGHWHKEESGKCGNTRWFSLDYPGHGGRWWMWVQE